MWSITVTDMAGDPVEIAWHDEQTASITVQMPEPWRHHDGARSLPDRLNVNLSREQLLAIIYALCGWPVPRG